MKNKLSKSRMQVIDSQSSSDFNAPTIPLTPQRSCIVHSRNNKVGDGYQSLIDDASSMLTSQRSNATRSAKHLQRNDDGSVGGSSLRSTNLRSQSFGQTVSSSSTKYPGNSSKLVTKSASFTTNDSSELCLPLPSSRLPHAKTIYGREKELAFLKKRLSKGGALTSIYGREGIGKTHLAIHTSRRWLEERPYSRFVVWINAATEWTLRVSYLEALKQVLMGNLDTEGNDEMNEDSERGEIIIVADLLHRQLKQQRKMDRVRETPPDRRTRDQKYRGSTSEDRDDEETRGPSSCQVLSNDTSDWGDEGTVASASSNENEAFLDPMDTATLAHLLWDSLLQGISTDYEWLVVFQNVPGAMGGVKGPAGLEPFLFPMGKTPPDEWLQGRILFTTIHKGLTGATSLLGRVHSLQIDRLEESAAVRMLISNAVFDGDREVGRNNLASPLKEQIFQEAEKIGQKLVGPHYLDGSPLMISTAVGYIVSTQVSLKEYYSQLKHQVAAALETSGYGTGKVQCIVKRETSTSVCLEQALDKAHARDLGDVLSAAVFVCSENIPLKLLGGDEDRVRMLCDMNLLTQVADQTYSMHRIHQRTAMDAIVTASSTNSTTSSDHSGDEFLCTPDQAVLALLSAMSTFVADDAATWHDARCCLPHVEALRSHHDLLERTKQLSPSFNHHFYAEIISRCASTLQWAMKDRVSAFSWFTEALRLQRTLFQCLPSSERFSTTSSSNMKTELASLLCKTLSSLGDLTRTPDESYEYHKEALDIFCQTFGENSKSIELLTLYIALADASEKLQNCVGAYEFYKKTLELYFTIYGHNQDIYANDQKMFLAETLLKVGNLSHHKMQKHAEAQLYLEGAVSLLRHVLEVSNERKDYLADAYETLGSISHAQGQLDDAKEHYTSALSLKNSIHGGKKWTNISNKYCTNNSKDGTVDTGLSRSEDGVKGNGSDSFSGENTIGDVRIETLRKITNEVAYEDLELVPISNEARKRACAIRDKKLARTLHRLGVMAWNLGSLQQAEDYFEKALSLQLSGYGVDAKNKDLAITLFSLGVLSNDLHNNQLKACSYYQKALDCYYFVHGQDSHDESIAQLLHALGQSLQILKKPLEAKAYFTKVRGLVQDGWNTRRYSHSSVALLFSGSGHDVCVIRGLGRCSSWLGIHVAGPWESITRLERQRGCPILLQIGVERSLCHSRRRRKKRSASIDTHPARWAFLQLGAF
jgi:tetratricopeptide (TPR) repeat protein